MQSGNEPTKAQRARELMEARAFGVLATVSKRMPGFPFASVMPYALDGSGRPLFLLSGLAVHTKNLLDDARASLLVYEAETESDPLSSARMNVMGEVRVVPDADLETARATYIARHPDAEQYAEFGDFSFFRLEIADVYYIGGFGEMGWVSRGDYAGAR